MEIVITKTPADAAQIAAADIASSVSAEPDYVLGLATGSTPLPLYQTLAEYAGRGVDFSAVRGFALDEYVGLPEGHPESYREVIRRTVVGPLGMNPALVHVPNGAAEDLAAAGPRYDAAISAAGGVGVQILGIGANGHIGFNEPGSSLSSRTRVKTLTERTRRDNARFFDSLEQVPTHCLTQGLGTIMESKRLFLFAFGASKADAISAAVEGPLSAFCPASIIQLHEHATVLIDEAAASKLTLRDYYRYVYANKPEWQQL